MLPRFIDCDIRLTLLLFKVRTLFWTDSPLLFIVRAQLGEDEREKRSSGFDENGRLRIVGQCNNILDNFLKWVLDR